MPLLLLSNAKMLEKLSCLFCGEVGFDVGWKGGSIKLGFCSW